jgi:hypothetical protein
MWTKGKGVECGALFPRRRDCLESYSRMFRRLLLTSSLIALDSFPLNYSRQSVVLRTSKDRLQTPLFSPSRQVQHSNFFLAIATAPGRLATMPASSTRSRLSSRASVSKQLAEDSENKKSIKAPKVDEVPTESSSSSEDEKAVVPSKLAPTKKKTSPKKRTASKTSEATEKKATKKTATPDKKKRGRRPKGSTATAPAKLPEEDDEVQEDDNAGESDTETKPKASKKPKSATTTKKAKSSSGDHQRVTERSELPKLWNPVEARDTMGSYSTFVPSLCLSLCVAEDKNHLWSVGREVI